MIWMDGTERNGADAAVSVYDHGLLYGDGVFEGIRIYAGRAFKLEDHMKRLFMSARAILLEIPYAEDELTGIVSDLVAGDGRSEAYIRLVVTRGVGPLGIDPTECTHPSVIIVIDRIRLYPEELYERGIPVICAATRRNRIGSLDPRIKSLNYLNNVLAKLEARRAGCIEAVMLTEEGYVSECTGDNIAIVKDGVILTPDAAYGALAGITLGTVLDIAREIGIPCRSAGLTRYDLYTADECFLTGTAAEIMPVSSVDGRRLGEGTPGEITLELCRGFKRVTGAAEAGSVR